MFSIAVCAAFALHCAVQKELNDANKMRRSSTTQNHVVNLTKISGLLKQDTPFLLRLILNPLAKGLHCMPPS
jgi:hypothetical protein